MLFQPCPHCGAVISKEELERIKLREAQTGGIVPCINCATKEAPTLLKG